MKSRKKEQRNKKGRKLEFILFYIYTFFIQKRMERTNEIEKGIGNHRWCFYPLLHALFHFKMRLNFFIHRIENKKEWNSSFLLQQSSSLTNKLILMKSTCL